MEGLGKMGIQAATPGEIGVWIPNRAMYRHVSYVSNMSIASSMPTNPSYGFFVKIAAQSKIWE